MSTNESGQSPLVRAYFELVDASGLSDEEFERRVEAAKEPDNARECGCSGQYGKCTWPH